MNILTKGIRLGTRPSLLARKQVREIEDLLPEILFDILPIETRGDRDKVTSLLETEKTDFFTFEIEKALKEGVIDAAVHSAKDLEDDMPEDLVIAATTKVLSPYECLVSNGDLCLDELPFGSTVGTSSRRRKNSILGYRKDLKVKSIRGNIDERIGKLDAGEYDAIIVAHAAMIRLGYEERIAQVIPRYIIEPHPLQGRLAIQVRRDRADLIELFRGINHGCPNCVILTLNEVKGKNLTRLDPSLRSG